MKKVCVVTGTRAEYGLLKPLIGRINEDKDLELQLVVTGTHLSPEFGITYNEIINDNFKIDEKVEILLSSDTSVAMAKSMGLAMISFSEVFERLKPDMLVVLGDRYEIFSVASAAMISKIPIAHIHGGEITEGAIDESIRHSITKMSYLHFTCTEEYKNRVIQLGENPSRVFNVGAIGVEIIKNIEFLSKAELEEEINFKIDKSLVLVTFHPVTLEENLAEEQFKAVLNALDNFDNLNIIFTKANADSEGRIINNMIDEYVTKNNRNSIAFASMGQLKYLSAMNICSIVIGNSSSGIIEAPILNKITVNIGNRQKGRFTTESIINCDAQKHDIIQAINLALDDEFKRKIIKLENPYGNGETSAKILQVIKEFLLNNKINLKKKFYDFVF